MQAAEKEPDARAVYGDIIDRPHHRSAKHRPMSLYSRAAQFSAFDALAGFSDMIAEEARMTDGRLELSEEAAEALDRKLGRLCDAIENGGSPEVTVVYFVPDRFKDGGSYEMLTGLVKQVDPVGRKLVFRGRDRASLGKTIDLGAIRELYGVSDESI